MPIRVSPAQLEAMQRGGVPEVPRPSEADVQKSITGYLSLRGAEWVRVNGGGLKRGKAYVRFNYASGGTSSDLLVCYRGVFIAMEVKRDETETTTKKQSVFLDRVTRAGGVSCVVRSVQDAERVLWSVDQQLEGK